MWIFLRSPRRGDSIRCPQHVFLRVNNQEASLLLLFILLCVGIPYSSKFFLTAKSKGTNTVVITSVHSVLLRKEAPDQILKFLFSSTGQRPEELMSWQFVRRACVRASVNSFLVSAIETTFLNQSGPNLHEVFMGTRSRMSSIVSKICPVTPGLLPLKY